jgi:peptide/nickel transport system substrate-binding protein
VVVQPESVYYSEDGWLEVPLGITGWGSRPVPQFYLNVMLTCDAQGKEAHWCDEEVDRLIGIAGSTLDEQKRIDSYRQIQEILLEWGLILVPYFFPQLAAISDEYGGFELGRSDLAAVTAR